MEDLGGEKKEVCNAAAEVCIWDSYIAWFCLASFRIFSKNIAVLLF